MHFTRQDLAIKERKYCEKSDQYFLLFPQCFQKLSSQRIIKTQYKLVEGQDNLSSCNLYFLSYTYVSQFSLYGSRDKDIRVSSRKQT